MNDVKTIICKECGDEFILSSKQQPNDLNNRLSIPKRCKKCREINKYRRALSFDRIRIEDLKILNEHNTLFVIGNGFDLMYMVKIV